VFHVVDVLAGVDVDIRLLPLIATRVGADGTPHASSSISLPLPISLFTQSIIACIHLFIYIHTNTHTYQVVNDCQENGHHHQYRQHSLSTSPNHLCEPIMYYASYHHII
jgi:hypothetical protein